MSKRNGRLPNLGARSPAGVRRKRKRSAEITPAQCIGPLCAQHQQAISQLAKQCLADAACRASLGLPAK
jgi:hypothetical protein